LSRYAGTSILSAGSRYGTAYAVHTIRISVSSGRLRCNEITTSGIQRLDILAGIYYNDSSLWWVLAAASNIGWGLQVPPGTLIKIPELDAVRKLF
jgi:hypothetical protein